MVECKVLGCDRMGEFLTSGEIETEVCVKHAGPNATPITHKQ